MKAQARISLVCTAILVLVMGTVLQHHHHGAMRVCMCLNPIEHCENHHHQADGLHGADHCCNHGCNHGDARGCSLHLDYGEVAPVHDGCGLNVELVAILIDRTEIYSQNSKPISLAEAPSAKTRRGCLLLRHLRGPPTI